MWWELHGFWPQLLLGTLMTIKLALCALVLGMGIGLAMACARLSSSRLLAGLARLYTNVIRGVPELLGVLLIYFGASQLVQLAGSWFGYQQYIEVGPFIAGVLALSLAFGGYAAEVFRGAFLAIPSGQYEAARVLGMGRLRCFWRITLPQLWRTALPGLGNLFLVLLKDTALVSVIGLEELMRKASLAVTYTREPFTFYFTATLMYLLLTWVTMQLLTRLEQLSRKGFKGGL